MTGAQSYLAVLSGPNCLAGEAEIQGFLPEAEKTPDIGTDLHLFLATQTLRLVKDKVSNKCQNKQNQTAQST